MPSIVPAPLLVAAYVLMLGSLVGNTLVSYLHLGRWNLAITLFLAWTNAVLIALFFMRVRYSGHLVRLAAAAALFWVGVMWFLTMSDYVTRGFL